MNIVNKIRSLSRKTKVAVAVLALGVSVAVPFAVQAEFYPDRPVFDYNKHVEGEDCNDPNAVGRQGGRCGSMNGPVFNSFVNTPSAGDERAFFDGRRTDTGNHSFADDINNVNEGSKEVILHTYVHNNANQSTNASGKGIATNTNVRIALPTAEEQVLRGRSYIKADNAAMVEDTVDFIGTEKFKVEYIPGSAKMLRGSESRQLSDSIVTTGASLGDLPGCFDYAAVVEIRVKINVKETPNLQFFKEVRKTGEQDWKKEVQAKPGEEVQYRLSTKNISNYNLTNVVVRDVLPPHVQLVPGSVRLFDANQNTPIPDGPVFAGGAITATNQQPGGIRYVLFKAKALDDFKECQIRVRNMAFSKSNEQPQEQRSDADVIITRDNCKPEEKPTYVCEVLKGEIGTNRTVKYTATASGTGGATIKSYTYDFGDGETFTTDKNVVEHTYKADGNFVTRVKVQFAIGSQTVTAESDKCAVPVNFTSAPGKPGTPTTPGKLPETGAGSTIAIFAAVTAAATGAYYAVMRRAGQL